MEASFFSQSMYRPLVNNSLSNSTSPDVCPSLSTLTAVRSLLARLPDATLAAISPRENSSGGGNAQRARPMHSKG
eukprot:14256168-Alexandrium_andersonii.AAC.1